MPRENAERFREMLLAVLKEIDQSERYERLAIQIRDVLGLCVTTGCDNERTNSGDWSEYCAGCCSEAE